MMEQLGITSIRQGANGRDPNAPNAANYDEAKGNPYPESAGRAEVRQRQAGENAKNWWKQAPRRKSSSTSIARCTAACRQTCPA